MVKNRGRKIDEKFNENSMQPSIHQLQSRKNSFGSQTGKVFSVTFIVKMRKFKFLLQTVANNKHKKLHKIKHEKMPSLLI